MYTPLTPQFRHLNRTDWTDTMQVCVNGHVITGLASQACYTKAHCPTCGKETLTKCPNCHKPIPGLRNTDLWWREMTAPHHCDGCGKSFPWKALLPGAKNTEAKMQPHREDAILADSSIRAGTVHIGTVIQHSTLTNSPVQISGPHGVQTMNAGTEGHELAVKAIRSVLEVVNEMGWDDAEKRDIVSQAKAAESLLESPNHKGLAAKLLTSIREKLTESAAKEVSEWLVSKAQGCISAISDAISGLRLPPSDPQVTG